MTMPPPENLPALTNLPPKAIANEIWPLSAEFRSRMEALKAEMRRVYTTISQTDTPKIDGAGRRIVDKRPDGRWYIIEAYMRAALDHHFPGWSLKPAAPLQFLGAEWVVAQVNLEIIDENLLGFGINPPIRTFYGVGSVRIQYSSGKAHIAENIIDVGDNCMQALSEAVKRSINRLTHIGDDIYGKRIDEEGMGNPEEVAARATNDVAMKLFTEYINEEKLDYTKVIKLVGPLNSIKEWAPALKIVADAHRGGQI